MTCCSSSTDIIVSTFESAKVSAAEEGEMNTTLCCASCGIAGVDDIKLKECNGCDLVKYCSDECQEDHRPKHKEECKKRAAELLDEFLFKQTESSCYGDCPICCLPIPIDPQKSVLSSCCSKTICNGCDYANKKREAEGRLEQKCLFCRRALAISDEEIIERWMKRIEANDPVAMRHIGIKIWEDGDYNSAFQYYTKAAALGDIIAHYQLSCLYRGGKGVEKDEKKSLYHAEQAALGGHPAARNNLGCAETQHGRYDKAAKHFIIAANLGYDDSLKSVRDLYKTGHVSKEDFATALRGHKAAIDATKSPQREEAAAILAERDRRSI